MLGDSRTYVPSAARVSGAVGFIISRWLLAVCNVPEFCGWLAGLSSILAAMYLTAFVASPKTRQSAVLGRCGEPLLAVTCALSLAGHLLAVAGPDPIGWRAAFAAGLDLAAWAWALAGALAAARWLWPEAPLGTAGVGPGASATPRHLLVSALVVLVLGLQVAAFFRARPTLWPFIDYPLYGAAHGEPVRAVHHRLYGLTAQEPVRFFEISADALGMSWFVYHTQLIPRMFDNPRLVVEEFRSTLARSDLPPLRLLLPERTTFALVDSELVEFPERRPVPLEPASRVPVTDAQHGSGAAATGAARSR